MAFPDLSKGKACKARKCTWPSSRVRIPQLSKYLLALQARNTVLVLGIVLEGKDSMMKNNDFVFMKLNYQFKFFFLYHCIKCFIGGLILPISCRTFGTTEMCEASGFCYMLGIAERMQT